MTVDARGAHDPHEPPPIDLWRWVCSVIASAMALLVERLRLSADDDHAPGPLRPSVGREPPVPGIGSGHSGLITLFVPDGPVLVPGHSPSPLRRQLRGWMEQGMVCLFRTSAWRYARSSRVSMVPGRGWSVGGSRVDDGSATTAPEHRETSAVATPCVHSPQQPSFPIDVVYTWVDDRDPVWQARYREALSRWPSDGLNPEAVSPARFHSRDELRYSLRSLARYAPFVRNVYIVTAGQVPSWLDPDVPHLRVVPHEEILDADCLPTFNSHAIESGLHRIEGLAEHYLYLNDDFFFGRSCHATMFFTATGRPKLFPDQRAMVPDGPCSPVDRAVDSASKNTREIMWADFEFPVKYKMQHVPYAQRRDVLAEMEERFPLAFKQTAHNPFRHYTDVNIASCLSHYYALLTGAAVTGRVRSSYINIRNPWAGLTMRRLLQCTEVDVFCLNDGPMGEKRRSVVDVKVGAFLEAYFPVPSPYERVH
jgi:hypothetical protein